MAQPFDLEAMSQQMISMRDQLQAAATRMEVSETSAESGGVTVTLTGSGELRSVRIDPQKVDSISSLEHHFVAAHADAFARVRRAAEDSLSPLRDLVARGPGS